MKRTTILFFKTGNKCTQLLADIAKVHKRDPENPSRYFEHYRSISTQQKIQDITQSYGDLLFCDETSDVDITKVDAALMALLHTEAAPYETKVYQLPHVGEYVERLGAGDEDTDSKDIGDCDRYWSHFYGLR